MDALRARGRKTQPTDNQMKIFCLDERYVTIRRYGQLWHFQHHCLLRAKNTELTPNNKLCDRIGQLLCNYHNDGLGQSGTNALAFWQYDRCYQEWNNSLIAALYNAPMRYLRVSESVYEEKLWDLPPLIYDCHVYCFTESDYQHRLSFITGGGNFIGGYCNSSGFYLMGLPESTVVLPWHEPIPNSASSDRWSNAKTVLQLYQNN